MKLPMRRCCMVPPVAETAPNVSEPRAGGAKRKRNRQRRVSSLQDLFEVFEPPVEHHADGAGRFAHDFSYFGHWHIV